MLGVTSVSRLDVTLSVQDSLPRDDHALLVGRAWLPSDDGPAVIGVRGAEAVDLTRAYLTVSHLLNVAKPADVRSAIRQAPALGRLDVLVANSVEGARDRTKPWLLAPCDLQAVKASGVPSRIATSFGVNARSFTIDVIDGETRKLRSSRS